MMARTAAWASCSAGSTTVGVLGRGGLGVVQHQDLALAGRAMLEQRHQKTLKGFGVEFRLEAGYQYAGA